MSEFLTLVGVALFLLILIVHRSDEGELKDWAAIAAIGTVLITIVLMWVTPPQKSNEAWRLYREAVERESYEAKIKEINGGVKE